jgi:hypothetical protein
MQLRKVYNDTDSKLIQSWYVYTAGLYGLFILFFAS